MEWGRMKTKAQWQRPLCAELGSDLRRHPHIPCSWPPWVLPGSPFPSCSASARTRRGSRRLFRRLALVPSNLFPTSFCVGGGGASPASPRASHQPSTRPHSLLVCVVKSSQYSRPESVNSSVPCLLPLPKGCQVCCPLPQWAYLLSCLTLSPGKQGRTTSPEEVCWEKTFQLPWVTWHRTGPVPGRI